MIKPLLSHTCLRGPSNIWSVYSLVARRFAGKSPQYLSVAVNAKQASSASSSLPTSLRSNGCFKGSREWRHNSSGSPRRADVNVRALDIVLFGGSLLKHKFNVRRKKCFVTCYICVQVSISYELKKITCEITSESLII